MEVLGIDIGGSGVKAAVVDTKNGELISQKIRFPTPENASPKKIFSGIESNFINEFNWTDEKSRSISGTDIVSYHVGLYTTLQLSLIHN